MKGNVLVFMIGRPKAGEDLYLELQPCGRVRVESLAFLPKYRLHATVVHPGVSVCRADVTVSLDQCMGGEMRSFLLAPGRIYTYNGRGLRALAQGEIRRHQILRSLVPLGVGNVYWEHSLFDYEIQSGRDVTGEFCSDGKETLGLGVQNTKIEQASFVVVRHCVPDGLSMAIVDDNVNVSAMVERIYTANGPQQHYWHPC